MNDVEKITVTPYTPSVGAIIGGIDLSQPMSPEVKNAVEQALVKHGVIFFENQHNLTSEKQLEFARMFGRLHSHPFFPKVENFPELICLDTNLKNPPDSNNWHTDVTFISTPPMGCVLRAVMLPPCGGDTCWASTVAAYNAMSEPMKTMLDKLTAVHDFTKGFPPERWTDVEEAKRMISENPPVSHPLVRTHPVSGANGIFGGDFCRYVNKVPKEESAMILQYLTAFVSKPEFTCRWHWKAGDVAFWDNRQTQHYATGDYLPHRRVMHRATILGDRPFGPALPKN